MPHINTCLSCDPISAFLMVCDTIEHVDSLERVRMEKDAYHDNYIVKLLLFLITHRTCTRKLHINIF